MPASCSAVRAADHVGRLGDDLERLALVGDLFGTGVEHRREDVVFGRALGGNDDHALAREVVRDTARVGHGAAVAGHQRAHLGGGAVLVVGQTLDEQCDPVRAVALVHDGRVLDGLTGEPRAALDGAVDVVVRDRGLLRLLHGVDEGRVAREVGTAHLRGDLDVLDQLGERLGSACVDDRLLVLRRCPLGMPGHASPESLSWRVSPPTDHCKAAPVALAGRRADVGGPAINRGSSAACAGCDSSSSACTSPCRSAWRTGSARSCPSPDSSRARRRPRASGSTSGSTSPAASSSSSTTAGSEAKITHG